jgi:hypothetical protein
MTIALLSFVAFAAGQLFRKSMMLNFDDRDYQNRASEVSSAVDQLRRDVWGSSRIDLKSPGEVHLQAADGSGQSWRIDADGSVTRTPDEAAAPRASTAAEASATREGSTDSGASATPTRWESIGANWAFASDMVSVSVIDSGKQSAGQVRLVSQILLGRSRS